MGALPEEITPEAPLRRSYERMLALRAEFDQALEEMRLAVYVTQTLERPDVQEALQRFAEYADAGKVFDDALRPEEVAEQIRAHRSS